MAKLTCLLPLFLTFTLCHGYKILLMAPIPSKSHGILCEGLVRHLLAAGHEITYATPYPKVKAHPKLHVIDLTSNLDLVPEGLLNVQKVMNKESDLAGGFTAVYNMIATIPRVTLEYEHVQKLLTDQSQTFDAVITTYFGNGLYHGLAALYDCPLIWFNMIEPYSSLLGLIDDTTNPAYVPSASSSNVPPFTFRQRVQELISQTLQMLLSELYLYYAQESDYNKIFTPLLEKRGRTLPPYSEVIYNASLVLGNSHVSYSHAMRLPINYIQIGGYYVNDNVEPLPSDLQKILDNAKHGTIYFSLGSNLKSKDFPENIKKGLIKLFSGLKQTVIWKFEEVMPNLPKNVHILKWAPQQSILAHPNTILFITHGGGLSTTETIHFGKPIIGIPVFGDQFNNIVRAVKKGFAKKVDLSYSLVEDLEESINDVLSDNRYAIKAKELSLVYHDRPVPPGVELVHWVEHVIKTRGAPHLRSPALRMPLYQKLYLDLAALVLVILYGIRFALKILFARKPLKVKKN
ncbi:hypothetical protein ABMA28_008151 [Loxostege sticticalis]|uniref:UDP-glucuronosyltransferase n=1 Tax=Loxostege sticticalis TaxID=481309 RepID=A0ABD0SG62_LOXSC